MYEPTDVADPTELGINPQRLAALRDRIRREIDSGLLPSCQIAVARHGRLALFETLGDATNTTRYNVYSATKPWIASVVWQLIAEGLLDVSAKVTEFIPEFGTNGKDVITVEQVMLHTSGFPHAPMGPPAWSTHEGRIERMAEWRLNWEPGTRYEYHPTSAHWVLGELIHRITGQDHRDAVRTRVAEPLGLDIGLGLPPEQQQDIAEMVTTGEPATPDELEAVFGVRELFVGEVTDEALLSHNLPEWREVGIPGGGGITTAAHLALFYQALMQNPGGLWDPDVLADATGRVRNSLPDPFGFPANRGLGVIIAGDPATATRRGFGKTQSPRAFGHNGAAGQLAWGDPATGLSLGYCTNGIDQNQIRQPRRGVAISSLAAVLVED